MVIDIDGKESEVKTVMVMMPESEASTSFVADYYNANSYHDFWYDIEEPSSFRELKLNNKAVSKENIFSYKKGMLEKRSKYINIEYSCDLLQYHTLDDTDWFGNILYRDIQGFDKNNQSLSLDFYLLDNAPYAESHDNLIASRAIVAPWGWNKEKQLETLHKITATADYLELLPPQEYPVIWQAGKKQEFQLGNIHLKVTPQPNTSNEYLLEYSDYKDELFFYFMMDGIQGKHKLAKPHIGPKWLTNEQRKVFAILTIVDKVSWSMEHGAWSMELKLDKVQSEVTFYVGATSPHPKFSQQVEFIVEQDFILSPLNEK